MEGTIALVELMPGQVANDRFLRVTRTKAGYTHQHLFPWSTAPPCFPYLCSSVKLRPDLAESRVSELSYAVKGNKLVASDVSVTFPVERRFQMTQYYKHMGYTPCNY